MKIYRKINFGFLMILPGLICIGTVVVFPLIYTFFLSFYETSLYSSGMRFVGLQNFIDIFGDPRFTRDLSTTAKWTVSSVAFQYGIGLIGALALSKIKGQAVFRSMLLLPWIIPVIVSAILWEWMYNIDYGLINFILKNMGVINNNINWLEDPRIALLSLILVNTWKMFPFSILMLSAGMQTIPEQLYEAAKVDGANAYKRFLYITLPQLFPTSSVLLLLLSIWSLNSFTFNYAMTHGGPIGATEIVSLYVYFEGFVGYTFGKGSCAATILFVITFVFSMAYLYVLRKKGVEI